jgi:hypothetical protein
MAYSALYPSSWANCLPPWINPSTIAVPSIQSGQPYRLDPSTLATQGLDTAEGLLRANLPYTSNIRWLDALAGLINQLPLPNPMPAAPPIFSCLRPPHTCRGQPLPSPPLCVLVTCLHSRPSSVMATPALPTCPRPSLQPVVTLCGQQLAVFRPPHDHTHMPFRMTLPATATSLYTPPNGGLRM